jgi:Ca-activated chloride channel family protein
MKSIIAVLIFLTMLIDPTRIGKINAAKADAKKTFNEGKYQEAIKKYRYLIESLHVDEDEVKLNLAHAYYLAKDTANAKPIYQSLTQSLKNEIRSKALQQLGVMNNSLNKSEEALAQFKQAIKTDPSNEDARYNYEMLKKKLNEKKKQEQQNQPQNKDKKDKKDQNKDQQNKDEQNKQDQKDKQDKEQQNKDQQNQKDKQKEQEEKERKEQEQKEQQKKEEEQKAKEQKEKEDKEKKDKEKKDKGQEQDANDQKKEDQKKKDEIPSDVRKKLQELNLSPEKAQMILDAMKNQEQQYLQQNKRKATKPKDKGKPDW